MATLTFPVETDGLQNCTLFKMAGTCWAAKRAAQALANLQHVALVGGAADFEAVQAALVSFSLLPSARCAAWTENVS